MVNADERQVSVLIAILAIILDITHPIWMARVQMKAYEILMITPKIDTSFCLQLDGPFRRPLMKTTYLLD